MLVKKIEAYRASYKNYLQNYPYYQEDYKWEALLHFQNNWDITAEDFGAMYDKSLHSNISRKLWTRSGYEPKAMMLKFVAMQPDYVKSMFRDLFDENKSIDSRVVRFVFYCDELLSMYKQKNKNSIENNHGHDNYEMIFVYLAFRYPEKYTLYNAPEFKEMLVKIGSAKIPLSHDLEQFVKVTKILANFLKKDEELIALIEQKKTGEEYYQDENLLMVHDFYWSCNQEQFEIKI